jgi:hypothetical protein
MGVETIGTILENFGLPLGIIVILVALVWFLISHILKSTVPSDVYGRTCEDQKKLESAITQMSEAVRELTVAHNATTELVRVLVGRDRS